MRPTTVIAAAAAAVALTLVPAGSAQAASRTCSAEDLEGARAPALLRNHGLDTQEDPLVVGTRYRVVVVQELAIGDNSQPVDGSIAVTAPDGPPLEASTEDRRPVYDFTPTGPGSVRLVVSWDQEVGYYGSGDICSASQAFDLPVLAPTAPTLEGVFRRGPRTFESSFLLRLHGEEPQDPGKIDVILRARRDTTRPPAPQGRALATFRFRPTGSGGFSTRANERELRRTFYADTVPAGVRIYPYGNIAFGGTLRFAFSLEVLQSGRRIGGMSSGAKCRRIQFPGHSAVKCRAVGLARHP